MKTIGAILVLVAMVACGRKPPPPPGSGFALWRTPRIALGVWLGQLAVKEMIVRDPRSGKVVASVMMDEPSGIGVLRDGSVLGVGVIDVKSLAQEAVLMRPDAEQAERYPVVTILVEGSARVFPDVFSSEHFYLAAGMASRVQLERYRLTPMTMGDRTLLPVRVVSEVDPAVFTTGAALSDGTFIFRKQADLRRFYPGQTGRTIATLEAGDQIAPASGGKVWVMKPSGSLEILEPGSTGRGIRIETRAGKDVVAFTGGAGHAALLTTDGTLRVYRQSDGAARLEAALPFAAELRGERLDLALSPDGAIVAVGGARRIAAWDVEEGKLLFSE